MNYTTKNRNGDAGQYLVAYTITYKFGWPCRLLNVDLGVDAEMEIIDENLHSTGDIIKIQVKTKEKINTQNFTTVRVNEKHIEYWKKSCVPVIICCVDLSKTKVYWKPITTEEVYKCKKFKKIRFCLEQDVLDENSKNKLCSLVYPSEAKNIDVLINQLIQKSKKLPNSITIYGDYISIDKERELCKQVDADLKKLELLMSNFPWRISLMDRSELNNIKLRIQDARLHLDYQELSLVEDG